MEQPHRPMFQWELEELSLRSSRTTTTT